jgi:hypothetical protein
MHPAQIRAIHRVDRGVELLSRMLMQSHSLDEDEALSIIRGLPDVVTRIQEGNLRPLLEQAVKAVPKREMNYFDQSDPKEYYPGHPSFRPPVATKSTFNAHAAQAMTPYVTAIIRRVAKDRNLEAPDEITVKKVLEKTDWARAAYEARQMPKRPPPGKLRQFFTKYIFGPLDKATDKVPLAELFGVIGASTVLYMLWATFGYQLERIGTTPLSGFLRYSDWQRSRTLEKLRKKRVNPSNRKWKRRKLFP